MVADFTNHKSGVYYEAGYVAGLARPGEWRVIHGCPRDQLDDLPFDVKPINMIAYSEPAELAENLKQRILGWLGEGPFAGRGPG